jgi:septum formation protein
MKLILGSSSKYRQAVLREHGYVFEVMKPDIDEKVIRIDDFYKLPILIARAKSEALQSRVNEPALIITADQVVMCDGELREKPETKEEAKKFFEKYCAGHPAETISALVVFNTVTGKNVEGIDIAKTFFKKVPDAAVDEFIESGEAYLTAGGFDHDNPILVPYVERIEGTGDSINGMPVHLLEKLLKEVE